MECVHARVNPWIVSKPVLEVNIQFRSQFKLLQKLQYSGPERKVSIH